MIDLNELKPILEKLDVDASVIESVIAIDKEVEPSICTVDMAGGKYIHTGAVYNLI